ncbi:GNAT family N-acetyltransferase [Sporosarcina thermotolerans]|uniref:GNAT family N-acetyltransferase n=1 Tax=Sporosarcina thermotolerans TaxID=633404 RepID=A0AAW9A7A6_9BACL|nr:GNAT family N-acetyltransferase [Sporosarcina thermotolerans]MDW0116513.1 GNAT family N-acetyltransferase [Sporosarcina thermotolerans]WHT48741.1 GNAT family N-acetyltransferase [Sporosarcina thermotolerans]
MDTGEQKVIIKNPTVEDAQVITDLISACDIEEIGEPDITLSDVLDIWNSVQIETDAWIALASTNEIIGYSFVEVTGANRMDTCVFVHPQYKNQGIGSLLLNKVEERANILAKGKDGVQTLMNQVPFNNIAARNLVENRGYQFSRLYERMKIELKSPPNVPYLHEGMTLRSFRPNHDEDTLFSIYDETFRDAWGYTKKDGSTWISQKKADDYDPSLWFIVWKDSEPVGFLMSRLQDDGVFIDLLGVKREYRKQGLGKAMLLHTFGLAYKRKQKTILLYVDSDSLTNANRLYQQVGMSPHSQTTVYSKQLTI